MSALSAVLCVALAAPAFDVEGVKDTRLVVTRGSTGTRTLSIPALDAGTEVAVRAGSLTDVDSKELRSSRLCFAPSDGGCRAELEVPDAGTALVLDLDESKLDAVGDYQGELRLKPKDAAVEKVPLRVVVTDPWWWPALTIFGGVAVAALVNFLSGRWKTREQGDFRLLRLRATVQRWIRTSRPGNAKLEQLLADLDAATQDNAVYLLDAARLSELAKRVDELRAERSATARQLSERLKTAKEAKPDPAQKQAFDTHLQEAQKALDADRLDDARDALDAADKLLGRRTAATPAPPAKPGARDRVSSLMQSARMQLALAETVVTIVSAVVATGTGLLALYPAGKPFGSLQQYVAAFLWGFGLDAGLRGFTAIYRKLEGP